MHTYRSAFGKVTYVLQDSYGRYLKSAVFKDTTKKAICPDEHRFKYEAAFTFHIYEQLLRQFQTFVRCIKWTKMLKNLQLIP